MNLIYFVVFFYLCLVSGDPQYKEPGDKDYYGVFGLKKENFSEAALKKAYNKLALKYHPDKNKTDPSAEKKFVELTKAFEVLNDKNKRQMYDQFGADYLDKHGAGGPSGFRDAEDIFKSFFTGDFGDIFGFGGGRRARQRTSDAQMVFHVSLEDAYLGATKEIEVSRQIVCKSCNGTGASDPNNVKTCEDCKGKGKRTIIRQLGPGFIQQMETRCQTCNGQGKKIVSKCKQCQGAQLKQHQEKLSLSIDPGVLSETTVKFSGMSDEHPDADTGDLYVKIVVESHPRFVRDGPHLYTTIRLTLDEALYGFTKKLEMFGDHSIKIERNQVTQPDQVLVVKGEGMPFFENNHEKGDLYVKFKVVLPSNPPINLNSTNNKNNRGGFMRYDLLDNVELENIEIISSTLNCYSKLSSYAIEREIPLSVAKIELLGKLSSINKVNVEEIIESMESDYSE